MKISMLVASIVFSNFAFASEGPISGGGGGPAVYQAIAISKIMKEISENMEVTTKFFPKEGLAFKSIEFISATGGHSVYLLRNSGDCFVKVETTAKDWSGMDYSIIWNELICPAK